MTQDLIEMRALFVARLATVDQRHADQTEQRREWIKGRILKMIKHIDAGKTFPQLVGQLPTDAYHGDF